MPTEPDPNNHNDAPRCSIHDAASQMRGPSLPGINVTGRRKQGKIEIRIPNEW